MKSRLLVADRPRSSGGAAWRGAQDHILALDRQSARRTDEDGHLHVADVPISKACVNPYLGREIPDWDRLGLDPQRVYHLLRDPSELEKAAATFNGKPLLKTHRPQTAKDHAHNLTVGAVDHVYWDAPYLRAKDFHVWDAGSIHGIETGDQKELSSAYRYDPDMTPGDWNGVRFDGRMTNIRGNHVALVENGRAGPDVVVGDSLPLTIIQEPQAMAKAILSRKAALAKGALSVYLKPKLAQDATLDLTAVLKGITAQNFSAKKPAIMERLKSAAAGKLAQDADLNDVVELLDALQEADAGPDDKVTVVADPAAQEPLVEDEIDAEAIKAWAKAKLNDEDHRKLCEMLGLEAAAPAAMDEPAEKKAAEPPITKQAMDAAIASATSAAARAAEEATIGRLNAVRAAERAVRPYVGELAMAHDTAEAVFRFALDSLGVTHAEIKEVAALKAVLEAQPKPGARPAVPARLAQDGAQADAYAKRFPDANRLQAH